MTGTFKEVRLGDAAAEERRAAIRNLTKDKDRREESSNKCFRNRSQILGLPRHR